MYQNEYYINESIDSFLWVRGHRLVEFNTSCVPPPPTILEFEKYASKSLDRYNVKLGMTYKDAIELGSYKKIPLKVGFEGREEGVEV